MDKMTRNPYSAFFFFRDFPQRRMAIEGAEPGSAERYCLFGMDQLAAAGASVRHNLESVSRRIPARGFPGGLFPGFCRLFGERGAALASVMPFLRMADQADIIVATTDRVGIPLVFLRRLGRVRRPVVYISMGLAERIEKMRSLGLEKWFIGLFDGISAIVVFNLGEERRLREIFETAGRKAPLTFIPFGVDTEYFRPTGEDRPSIEILSIGHDPHRDYALLKTFLERHPERKARIIADRKHLQKLGSLPANLDYESDIPFSRVRDELAAARLVVLPVRPNSYSRATTVLLQAMAMAKPVVVTAVNGVEDGYRLEDGVNCRLVKAGDADDLGRAILELSADPDKAREMGRRARETVLAHYSWTRFAGDLKRVIERSLGRPA